MASCPEVRQRVMVAVELDGPFTASSIEELKFQMGLGDVSRTKFVRALNSLCFHYKSVVFRRVASDSGAGRTYRVSCAMTRVA